jgi:hypothetical protein
MKTSTRCPHLVGTFAKIVVTDEAGRFLLPGLPKAKYSVWTRGYGLADSPKGSGHRMCQRGEVCRAIRSTRHPRPRRERADSHGESV